MQTWSRRQAAVGALAVLMSVVDAGDRLIAQEPAGGLSHGYSRPARSPGSSRSEILAPNGMVATSQPLAAQVGIEILKAGGNAVDAAVAVNAMLGLVEPNMNGIGGDLFAIVWDARTEQLYGLNATGRSPHAINRRVFERQRLERVPAHGPLPWTVPGAVDGWDQLLTRFGTMDFAEVLQPAIRYARDGFPVSEVIQRQWAAAHPYLAAWPDAARVYLPQGRPPAIGQIFTNPDLATTYETIARGGRDAFYRGSIARRIVAFSEANGGYFTMADFEDHTSLWVDPVSTNYRGYDVWEMPPNSSGSIALLMLNILEGYDLASMGHNSAEALHVLVEAKKLAFADRDAFIADGEATPLPLRGLISKSYAATRRGLIDPARSRAVEAAGDPAAHGSDTVYLTVVDRDRNAVSLIESIYANFGSKVVPGNLGFALQNRGMGFTLETGHPNSLEPHKRALHTNMPGFVTRNGRPLMAFGVMGGDMQPQGHVQVLSNIIDFGMNMQEAGDAARVRHGPGVLVEPGIPDEVVARLREIGHTVQRVGGAVMGGYQAIMIDSETGMLRGGSDPRKDGHAVGY